MDLLCLDDLDEYGREIDDPEAELVQDVVHTLLEAYGTNPDAPTRGLGLEDALSGTAEPSLKHRIETELAEDDRIDAVTATIADVGGSGVRIDLQIQTSDAALGIRVLQNADGSVTTVRT